VHTFSDSGFGPTKRGMVGFGSEGASYALWSPVLTTCGLKGTDEWNHLTSASSNLVVRICAIECCGECSVEHVLHGEL